MEEQEQYSSGDKVFSLKSYLKERGITDISIFTKTGMTKYEFTKKKDNVGDFTLNEIIGMAEHFNLKPQEFFNLLSQEFKSKKKKA